jgi:hypothetical protein
LQLSQILALDFLINFKLSPQSMQHLSKYEKFKKGNYKSINEFSKSNDCNVSVVALSKYWNKFIPEYNYISKQGKCYTF